LAEGAEIYVPTRSRQREISHGTSVRSGRGADEQPPEKLDAAILFAPVGSLVPPALKALDRGGVLVIAAST